MGRICIVYSAILRTILLHGATKPTRSFEQTSFVGITLYIPKINRSLTEFIHSWNNHPIRTVCHKTPHKNLQQLFTAGSLILKNCSEAFDFDETIEDNYGIDPNGPCTATEDCGIVVPVNMIKFSDRDLQAL